MYYTIKIGASLAPNAIIHLSLFSLYVGHIIEKGMLEFLYPHKPKSRYQKIKTSEKGLEMLFEH